MYDFIKGKYVDNGENYVVIENNGIGYKIFTSEATIRQLQQTLGVVTIFTHLNVREDAMDLFGFLSKEERGMFINLLSVSGVGPKAALSILSVTTPQSFAVAVITGDVKAITKASGVGPKLAQRVILELKDKLKNAEIIDTEEIPESIADDIKSEAISALVVLGYSANEAKKAVALAKGESIEELVKEALKKLMR